jgi:hypothetical protein
MEDRLVKLDKYREVGKNLEMGKNLGKPREMGIPRPMVHMDRAETSHDYNRDDDTYYNYTLD